jgi:hypothetical protein
METNQRIAGRQAPDNERALALDTITGADWRRELARGRETPNDVIGQVLEILASKGLTNGQ